MTQSAPVFSVKTFPPPSATEPLLALERESASLVAEGGRGGRARPKFLRLPPSVPSPATEEEGRRGRPRPRSPLSLFPLSSAAAPAKLLQQEEAISSMLPCPASTLSSMATAPAPLGIPS